MDEMRINDMVLFMLGKKEKKASLILKQNGILDHFGTIRDTLENLVGGYWRLIGLLKQNNKICVPQDYDVSSATPCLSIHAIYVMYCHYIRSLSVMLSRISFLVLYGKGALHLCCTRGLVSFNRIESGDPMELQTHREQTQHRVHETRFQMQQTEMTELRETDRRRQAQMVEILRVMGDMRQEMGDMQAELLALREQSRRARQPGSDARCQSSKPKTLDETIELANDFMDQKLCSYAKRQTNNKRKADDLSRNNHGHQQQPAKRQNVAKVYNIGTGKKKPYSGNLPKCTKCHFHHNGPCTQKCHKCNKVGHFAHDCRSSGNTNVAHTQKGNGENPKGNGCFECGAPGHFKRDCPKLKNKDKGNLNAQGWV
nr:hypothetical protein [Tanacetum cinerariifolium]